jgi:hypothetical protein
VIEGKRKLLVLEMRVDCQGEGASVMSKKLMLDLPDDIYSGLERTAAAEGRDLDEWLCERLQRLVSAAALTEEPVEQATPAFWNLPDIDTEERILEAELAALSGKALAPEEAHAATRAMVRGWFGGPMSETEALELAMNIEAKQ